MSEREALEAQVAAAHAAGDVALEARLLTEIAPVDLAWGDETRALSRLRRAVELYVALARPGQAARALQGAALMQWRTAPAASRASLAQAEALARRAGDLLLLASILDHKAGMTAVAKDYLAAAALMNDVAAIYESLGDETNRLAAIRRMATLVGLGGDAKRAFELLSEGLVGAEASPTELLRSRLDLALHARTARGSGAFPRAPGEAVSPLGILLADAVAANDTVLAGYVRLQMAADASQGRRHQEASTYAEGARQNALEAGEPMLYLLACLAIAEAREAVGDRVGVLTILFTCRVSLVDLLGEQAGLPVLGVIESLERRWGDAFEPALDAYRAQFR